MDAATERAIAAEKQKPRLSGALGVDDGTRTHDHGMVFCACSDQVRQRTTSVERGSLMAQGRERTKEQLYREAKRLGVKGRSKMNKGQLKAAVDRRR